MAPMDDRYRHANTTENNRRTDPGYGDFFVNGKILLVLYLCSEVLPSRRLANKKAMGKATQKYTTATIK